MVKKENKDFFKEALELLKEYDEDFEPRKVEEDM